MDHVVYLDQKANEPQKLLSGEKTEIVRGATGRKLPYGRVFENDILYFITNDGSGTVFAKARVTSVFNSEKLTPEQSNALLNQHQEKLNLNAAQIKRWGGKRYLVLIEIADYETLEPFKIDRSAYGNMDDWLPVEDIQTVKQA